MGAESTQGFFQAIAWNTDVRAEGCSSHPATVKHLRRGLLRNRQRKNPDPENPGVSLLLCISFTGFLPGEQRIDPVPYKPNPSYDNNEKPPVE